MTELGNVIREARELQSKTLKTLAEEAHVSAAYIQKLEKGLVDSPSPNKIQAIADALGLDYMALMRTAGYIENVADQAMPDELSHVLQSANLNDEERQQVANFVKFLKQNAPK